MTQLAFDVKPRLPGACAGQRAEGVLYEDLDGGHAALQQQMVNFPAMLVYQSAPYTYEEYLYIYIRIYNILAAQCICRHI